MIDQGLINHVDSYIVDGKNLPVNVTENILDAYIKLVEQNAELHKANAKQKDMLENAWNAICEAGYEDCCTELRDFIGE